jgi:isoaspartyl peptidase/L-asparaginase-like protein (Ntn-hydrolase superfamily)
MPEPIILSTWSFGKDANAAAWPALSSGGSSLDAVEAACGHAEADLTNHTVGRGGYPDRDGNVSLDASIMLSPGKCGAVAAVRRCAHPISLARRVMEHTKHFMLAGEGADLFAVEQGLESADLLTPEARDAWLTWKDAQQRDGGGGATTKGAGGAARPRRNIEELGLRAFDLGREKGDIPHLRENRNVPFSADAEGTHDTIGVLAIDARGTLAGACSTSGLAFKLPGRVGDSPVVGQGLYVDPDVGAAVTTGHGELMMGVCATFLAVESMRRGASPLDAAAEVLNRIKNAYDLETEDQCGIIVLSKSGQWASASLRDGFRTAVRTPTRDELVDAERVLLKQ